MFPIIFLICIALIIFLARIWFGHKTVQRLLSTPLNENERKIVVKYIPLYRKLPTDLRAKLDGKINRFRHQVTFYGVLELEVSDEMQFAIAAQACLLVVNKDDTWFKNLKTILVYPDAFKSRQVETNGYVQTVSEKVRIGESWSRGPVVLSWAHAAEGAFIADDGHNVVFHEFAHQLDDISGHTDGMPVMKNIKSERAWAKAFLDGYQRLLETIEAGGKPFLDPYGATDHAEFFAVSVEYFFEKPAELKHNEPEIFNQLVAYFNINPLDW